MKKIQIILLLISLVGLLILTSCSSDGLTGGTVANLDDVVSSLEPQIIEFGADRYGYVPSVITVEVDREVILTNDGTLGGCAMYVIQKELGIDADFSKSNTYSFTPTKKGTYTIACPMNMHRGTLKVI